MCFEDYSEQRKREDGSVKWSETYFPVYMDDIFISSVMRTSKLMGMTIVMITKTLQNPVTANLKKRCKLSSICLLTCSKSTIDTLKKSVKYVQSKQKLTILS